MHNTSVQDFIDSSDGMGECKLLSDYFKEEKADENNVKHEMRKCVAMQNVNLPED